MIISKDSKKLLDALISNTPDMDCLTFSIEKVCDLISEDEDAALRISKNLVESNLAEFAHWSSGGIAGVALKQDGLCYKEIQRLEAKERWKERIFGFVSGVSVSLLAELILKFAAG